MGCIKICPICKNEFIAKSARQMYCKQSIRKICLSCGSEFTTICSPDATSVCSKPECKKKAGFIGSSLKERKCRICGQLFKPESARQLDCNRPIKKICEVCGKEFDGRCSQNDTARTCSIECQNAFASQKRQEAHMQETRICEICGQKFNPRSNTQRVCENKHFANCTVCGKEFELNYKSSIGQVDLRKTCSDECLRIWQSQNSPFRKQEVQDKIKQTNLIRYGVERPSQNPEIADRQRKSTLDKYGVEYFAQSLQYRKIAEQTNLRKYGTPWPVQNDYIRQKQQSSLMDRYGVTNPMHIPEVRSSILSKCDNLDLWLECSSDPETYIKSHYQIKPTYKQIADDIGISIENVYELISNRQLTHLISYSISTMEDELKRILDRYHLSYKMHDRQLIAPMEIDIYIPKAKLGLECNPTCTHNSTECDPWGGKPKSRNYHKMKTDLCEAKGVSLIHIFSHEWRYKRPIIESIIRSKIGEVSNRIYARKCNVIEEVSWKDCFEFLETNHRQGNASSPIRLGLEYNGELVSVMTFSKVRKTIGTGNEDLTECYELVRFCSLLDTQVVGGASKLFNYFIKQYNPKQIRSFSDRAHTSGNLYSLLGFKEIRRSEPGYVWVNLITDKAYHRANAQKHNLKKFLNDDSIDLTKTETEIMVEHGFVQVFDSGTITWEWSKIT